MHTQVSHTHTLLLGTCETLRSCTRTRFSLAHSPRPGPRLAAPWHTHTQVSLCTHAVVRFCTTTSPSSALFLPFQHFSSPRLAHVTPQCYYALYFSLIRILSCALYPLMPAHALTCPLLTCSDWTSMRSRVHWMSHALSCTLDVSCALVCLGTSDALSCASDVAPLSYPCALRSWAIRVSPFIGPSRRPFMCLSRRTSLSYPYAPLVSSLVTLTPSPHSCLSRYTSLSYPYALRVFCNTVHASLSLSLSLSLFHSVFSACLSV